MGAIHIGNYMELMARLGSKNAKLTPLGSLSINERDELSKWPAQPVIAAFIGGPRQFHIEDAELIWCRSQEDIRRMCQLVELSRLTLGFYTLNGWVHDYLLLPLPVAPVVATMALNGVAEFLTRHDRAVLTSPDFRMIANCWTVGMEQRFRLTSGGSVGRLAMIEIGWPDENGHVLRAFFGDSQGGLVESYEQSRVATLLIRKATNDRWPESVSEYQEMLEAGTLRG